MIDNTHWWLLPETAKECWRWFNRTEGSQRTSDAFARGYWLGVFVGFLLGRLGKDKS